MGHKGGGRFDGSRGSLKVRRDEERARQRSIQKNEEDARMSERAARALVVEAATPHGMAAVQRIASLVSSENEYIALAASREMLRLLNAYPTKSELAGAGRGGNGDVKVIVMNYNGELPAEVGTVPKLPTQNQHTEAPAPEPFEAEFSNIGEPRATH